MKIAKTIMMIRVVLLLPELDLVDCEDVFRFELFVDVVEEMVVVLVADVVLEAGLVVELVEDSKLELEELVEVLVEDVLVVVELELEVDELVVLEEVVLEVEEVVDW